MSDNQFVGNNASVGAGAGPPLGERNTSTLANGQAMNSRPTNAGGSAAGSFVSSGEISHVSHLSEHIGSLFLTDDYADIELTVDDQVFRAHKVILACRSEYFRALLYGGLRESAQSNIVLVDTSVVAFRYLLRYIYTGKVTLTNNKEDVILEILGLAHKYGFADLESAISEYLKSIVSARNLCTIFGASHLYSLASLTTYCLEYADRHASDVLSSDAFIGLTSSAVQQLLSRDSFCADEIDIFRAVREWSSNNADEAGDAAAIVAHIRLPLMKLEDLLNVVRPSELIAAERLLDAIKEQNEKRDMDLNYRGCKMPNVNMATPSQGAQVIEGELKAALLNGDTQMYDMEKGFTRHPIEEKTDGIVIQLGMQSIINHIRLLLWDKDGRSYSYRVEVSMDKQDWVTVVDYSTFLCRSWQKLYFTSRVVKYIRIVGTHNTVNRVFHLVTMEAYHVNHSNRVDRATGLILPSLNVATVDNSAVVIEGVSRSRNALLNGDTENYDWDSGYTCHQLGSGAIVVQLPQPYLIESMRLLLWDCDDRAYSYYMDVSTDQQSWHRVADKTREPCKGWQTLRFARQPVTFVRIVGTQNTANEVFHCVHFECPAHNIEQSAAAGLGIAAIAGAPSTEETLFLPSAHALSHSNSSSAAASSSASQSHESTPQLGGAPATASVSAVVPVVVVDSTVDAEEEVEEEEEEEEESSSPPAVEEGITPTDTQTQPSVEATLSSCPSSSSVVSTTK